MARAMIGGISTEFWSISKKLAQKEGADQTTTELAALLHDIADWKFNDGDETAGPKKAADWLSKNNADVKLIEQVCELFQHSHTKAQE